MIFYSASIVCPLLAKRVFTLTGKHSLQFCEKSVRVIVELLSNTMSWTAESKVTPSRNYNCGIA